MKVVADDGEKIGDGDVDVDVETVRDQEKRYDN